MKPLPRISLIVPLLMALAACDGPLGLTLTDADICPRGDEPVGSVRLSQTATMAMRVNDEVSISAEALDPRSTPMYLCVPDMSWSSADPTVATVNQGRVRAVGVGETRITAQAGGKSASLAVVVSNAELAALTLSTDTATLLVGQTLRFSATGRDSSGNAISAQAIAWSTSDTSVASLTSVNRVLIAHAVGSVMVRATVGTRTATARVNVIMEPPPTRVRDIAAGSMHSCAIVGGGGIADGTAYCWGDGGIGALGNGSLLSRAEPTKVAGGLMFATIAAGERGSCAVTTSGRAYCWGDNASGQLGDGSLDASTTPRAVATSELFSTVQVARGLTCGLATSGRAWCWGAFANGRARVPIAVAGDRVYVELSGNSGDMCARTTAGDAYCWSAQSAWPTVAPTRVPSTVPFTQLSAGPYYSCGLTSNGSASCWGMISGQLGSSVAAATYVLPTPVAVLQGFSSIAVGGNFTCGIQNGTSLCLGNTELSNAAGIDPNPRRIPNDAQHPFTRIVGGSFHGCAIDAQGGGWCFGRGYEGQLGAGDNAVTSGVPLQLRFVAP